MDDVLALRGTKLQPQPTPDARIAWIAGQQSNTVSLQQLLGLGLTYKQVRGRVDRGQLHPRYRRVFSVGSRALDARGELIAAILCAGPSAWVSGATAAGLAKLRPLDLRRIELTLPTAHRIDHPGLIVHRALAEPHPSELTRWRGVRVSTVPLLLVEFAPTASQRELEEAITEAVHHKCFDLAAIEATLQRHPRRPGLAKLKRALRHYRDYASSKSKFERAFDRWLAKHPEIQTPLKNVYVDGWEIDRYWPEFNLAVELDGLPWHLAVPDRAKDNRKGVALQLLGIRVIRIDDYRWEYERNGILAELHAFMGL